MLVWMQGLIQSLSPRRTMLHLSILQHFSSGRRDSFETAEGSS